MILVRSIITWVLFFKLCYRKNIIIKVASADLIFDDTDLHIDDEHGIAIPDRSLSLSELNSIFLTEINNEFENDAYADHHTKLDQRWNDELAYEWNSYVDETFRPDFNRKSDGLEDESNDNRRLRKLWKKRTYPPRASSETEDEENSSNNDDEYTLHPFLCCCDKKKLQYGERCINHVTQYFGMKYIALHNHEEKFCVIVSSSKSAALIAGTSNINDILSITPLLPQMKLIEGTIDTIMTNGEEILNTQLNIMLCPSFQFANNATASEEVASSLLEYLNSQHNQKTGIHRFLHFQHQIPISSKLNYDNHPSGPRRKLWSDILRYLTELDGTNCTCDETSMSINISENGKYAILRTNLDNNQDQEYSNSLISSYCLLTIVATLATRSQVCSISIEPEISLLTEEVQWILQSGEENKRPWFDSNIDGTGQVVGLSDSGLDVHNCYFHDVSTSDFDKDGKVYSNRRKVVQYEPYADDSDMSSGHGTHVGGILAGFKQAKNAKENGRADGIAKGAKIAFFDVATSNGSVRMPNSPRNIFLKANEANAYIHSVSWGSQSSSYMYDESSIDSYLFDNQDNIVCAAAGNFGSEGEMSLASPSTSKNVISVGSTSKNKSLLNSVTGFSSRGPTMDGRMKPDVMAPGNSILSANAVPSTPGACDDSGGLKTSTGTSMSSPAVCGAAAIVRQYFEDNLYVEHTGDVSYKNPPSGPLIKAVLINGAITLQSDEDKDPILPYDNNQGFGRVSLINSMPLGRINNQFQLRVMDRRIITANTVDEYTVSINKKMNNDESCNIPLRVSLVWYDPPSSPGCSRCLLNDLDLFIFRNITVETSSSLSNSTSENPSSFEKYYANGRTSEKDDKNSCERIEISSVNDGEVITIIVESTDIMTDFQMYALVISGCLGSVHSNSSEEREDSFEAYIDPNLVLWDIPKKEMATDKLNENKSLIKDEILQAEKENSTELMDGKQNTGSDDGLNDLGASSNIELIAINKARNSAEFISEISNLTDNQG